MNVTKTNHDRIAFNKYWIPKKPHFEVTAEYFESTALTRDLPSLRNTGDDITERNVFTNSVITKKTLYDIEKKHALTLEMAKKKRQDLNGQWTELENTETEFRNSFLFFEQFVKENEMKRWRAKTKLEEVSDLIKKRNLDIFTIKRQIHDFSGAKIEMDTAIANLRIFEVSN